MKTKPIITGLAAVIVGNWLWLGVVPMHVSHLEQGNC